MSSNFGDYCEHNYVSFAVDVTTNCRLDYRFACFFCSVDRDEHVYKASFVFDWSNPEENDYELIARGVELLAWCRDEANQDKIIEGCASNDID